MSNDGVIEELPAIIELNVGGMFYTTRLSTLTKDPESMLAVMFSGRHVIDKTKDGRFFIDREGSSFKYILQYLRDGKTPPATEAHNVYEEACYYQITDLIEILGNCGSVRGLRRSEVTMNTMRERLGEEYKGFLNRVIDLMDLKRTDFIDKCFNSQHTFDSRLRKTVYEYQKAGQIYQSNLTIIVLNKDQARCTRCQEMVPIPTAVLESTARLSFKELTTNCLPELCIPSSLPDFVVRDYLVRDMNRSGEQVHFNLKGSWTCDKSTHEASSCTLKGYSDERRRFESGLQIYTLNFSL